MKKILLVLSLVFALFLLTGCSEGDTSVKETPNIENNSNDEIPFENGIIPTRVIADMTEKQKHLVYEKQIALGMLPEDENGEIPEGYCMGYGEEEEYYDKKSITKKSQ